jgi:hypothetical protein
MYLLVMSIIDFPIEKINEFLKKRVFKITTQPTHDENHQVTTNVKIKLTGVKDYLSVGEEIPHLQYTITILPTNEESDMWNRTWAKFYGKVLPITTSSGQYSELRSRTDNELKDFLNKAGELLNENGFIHIIGHKTNPWTKSKNIVKYFNKLKDSDELLYDLV